MGAARHNFLKKIRHPHEPLERSPQVPHELVEFCLQVNFLDGPSGPVRTVDDLLVLVRHVLAEFAGPAQSAHVVDWVLVVAGLSAQSVKVIWKFSSSLRVLIEQKDATSFVVVHVVHVVFSAVVSLA